MTERLERDLGAARTARPSDPARYAPVLERAVRACDADSEAADAFDPADLHLELATEYQALGRWDDALAAADAAVDAGRGKHLAPGPVSGIGTVAVAWLPADYEQAMRLWPALASSDPVAGPDGPLPHAKYCRAMLQRLKPFRAPGRNQPCWCGSGRNYKKYCAAPTSVDANPS